MFLPKIISTKGGSCACTQLLQALPKLSQRCVKESFRVWAIKCENEGILRKQQEHEGQLQQQQRHNSNSSSSNYRVTITVLSGAYGPTRFVDPQPWFNLTLTSNICYTLRYIFRIVAILNISNIKWYYFPRLDKGILGRLGQNHFDASHTGSCWQGFVNCTHTLHLSIGIEMWQLIFKYFPKWGSVHAIQYFW